MDIFFAYFFSVTTTLGSLLFCVCVPGPGRDRVAGTFLEPLGTGCWEGGRVFSVHVKSDRFVRKTKKKRT